MKKNYTSLTAAVACFVFLFTFQNCLRAQWQQTQGAGGGYSTGLYAKGDGYVNYKLLIK